MNRYLINDNHFDYYHILHGPDQPSEVRWTSGHLCHYPPGTFSFDGLTTRPDITGGHWHEVESEELAQSWIKMSHTPDLLAALADVELRTTQARIASSIGGKTRAQTVSFLLGEMERIGTAARAAIVNAVGK
jgi:hypothetical protein